MYKIITANNVEFVDPEGSFSMEKKDTVNTYSGEDGHTTIELIRTGKISASVSYNGLTVSQLKQYSEALTTVTTFKLYDPLSNVQKTITAQVSGVKVGKVFHRNDLSVWSLSFDIDEL